MFEAAKLFQKSFFIDGSLKSVYQREQDLAKTRLSADEKRVLYSAFRHAWLFSLYLDNVYPKWRKKKNSLLGMSLLFLALEERIFGKKAIHHTYQWLNKGLIGSRTDWLRPISRAILEKAPEGKASFYVMMDPIVRLHPYIAKILSCNPEFSWETLFEHPPLWIRCENPSIALNIPEEDVVSRENLAIQLRKTGALTDTLFSEGKISFQNIASQQLGTILEDLCANHGLNPSHVIETCAAPGGKSAIILRAFKMSHPSTTFMLTDLYAEKIQELEKNLDRQKCLSPFVKIFTHNWQEQGLKKTADLVLVDAPCSGSGVTRKHPDVFWKGPENQSHHLSQTQFEICKNALKSVAPAGFFIYSTCSLDREENDDVIAKIIAQDAGWSTIRADLKIGVQTQYGVQIVPSETFDGLYIAILKRKSL